MSRIPTLKELRQEYVSPVELSAAVGQSSEWIRTLAKRNNWRIAQVDGRGRGGKTLAIRIDSLPAEYRDKLTAARSAEIAATVSKNDHEFYFSLPYDKMDLCLYGKNNDVPPEQLAPAVNLNSEQVRKVYRDIDTKRSTTRYLHLSPLLVEETIGGFVHASVA